MVYASGLECWHALAAGRCRTGSNPTADNFASAIPFTPPCQCLSEETVKASAPSISSASMPGEVKDSTSDSALECVTVVDSTTHSKLPTSRVRLCG